SASTASITFPPTTRWLRSPTAGARIGALRSATSSRPSTGVTDVRPFEEGSVMATTHTSPTTYVDAATQRVAAANEIEYAYRDVGEHDVPLVLLQHFRCNLDNWDPALIDALAAERRVVTFDNTGVGATTGTTPSTIEVMARDAIAFIEALELERVDLLGFSIGSFVAQEIALIRPDVLRRVVLASSAPQGAAGMHGWAPEVIGAVGSPQTSPEGYLSVFFAPTKTSLQAG